MQKTGWFCLAVPSLCRLHIAPTRESPTVSDIGEKDQLVEVVLQYPPNSEAQDMVRDHRNRKP
jgi:hypothetical protein